MKVKVRREELKKSLGHHHDMMICCQTGPGDFKHEKFPETIELEAEPVECEHEWHYLYDNIRDVKPSCLKCKETHPSWVVKEKPHLLAPALRRRAALPVGSWGKWELVDILFSSENEAMESLTLNSTLYEYQIIWPAIPENGFYKVPL